MLENDAIQMDVSDAGDGQNNAAAATGLEIVLSPRDLAMQQITQQLEEGRVEVFADEGKQDATATTTFIPSLLPDDQLAVTKVRVIVDGEALELPLSEVTAGYQKGAAASKRLELAATEHKKLKTWEQDLVSREAALTTVDQSPFFEGTDGQIRAYNAALIEGDEEAAAIAFKAIMGTGRQQATPPVVIDEDALVARTETRIDNKKAWDEFIGSNEAFADVDSPQRVYGDHLFDKEFAPLVDAGEISYREALTRTAEGVAQKFTPPAAELTTRQQKEIRKQSIDNLPVAVGARVVKQPASTNTPVDVIERMKGWRGQAV